jgi:hypothetical protein
MFFDISTRAVDLAIVLCRSKGRFLPVTGTSATEIHPSDLLTDDEMAVAKVLHQWGDEGMIDLVVVPGLRRLRNGQNELGEYEERQECVLAASVCCI